jgi:hypothetical protein
MYDTTGFTKDDIVDLCVMIHAAEPKLGINHWPPILGLFKSVVVALTYMRRNRVQEELAETYEVSQPTISRAITAVTPLLGRVLGEYVPTADDLDGRTQYIVDGTLLPCWSWASHPELYSGKHKTTGMNVQVACTFSGRLAWISDPVNGSRHDTHCLSESGALLTLHSGNWVGDKGYVGNDMITPHQEARLPRSPGLGERIQQAGQQDPLCHRAGHRQFQDLADHAHRLSLADRNIRHDHLNSSNRLALLLGQLNNPRGQKIHTVATFS